MSAHTPGTWSVIDMKDANGDPITAKKAARIEKFCFKNAVKKGGGSKERYLAITPADDHKKIICTVGNGPAGPFNAPLIASAPDLLKSLTDLVAMCERQRSFIDDADGNTINRAKLIIARAKGASDAEMFSIVMRMVGETES